MTTGEWRKRRKNALLVQATQHLPGDFILPKPRGHLTRNAKRVEVNRGSPWYSVVLRGTHCVSLCISESWIFVLANFFIFPASPVPTSISIHKHPISQFSKLRTLVSDEVKSHFSLARCTRHHYLCALRMFRKDIPLTGRRLHRLCHKRH